MTVMQMLLAASASSLPITFVGSATGSRGGDGGAPAAITLPGGTQSGDLVVITAGTSATSTNAGVASVSTSGYTQQASSSLAEASCRVFTKRMTGTPDTSVTLTRSEGQAAFSVVVQVWRNVNATTPMDVTPTTASSSISTADNPAITPVTQGAIVVACCHTRNASSGTAPTSPTGYTNAASVSAQDVDSTFGIASSASKAWSGSGAENPSAWGYTSPSAAASASVTIALRPA